jgi:hypothetical protein
MPSLARSVVFACLCAAACGEAKDRSGEMAKALDNSKLGGGDKQASADGMKQLKAKAEAKAQAAHREQLDTLTKVDAPLPADLPAACNAAAAALDAFMRKRVTGDALGRWEAVKEPDSRKLVEHCTEVGKIEYGACLAKAYENAAVTEFAVESRNELDVACMTSYGAPPDGKPTPAEAKSAAPKAEDKGEEPKAEVRAAGIQPT